MRQIFTRNMAREGTPHYYGDTVRRLFLFAAFCMLFFMPFFVDYLPVSFQAGIFIILILSIFSGLTNPKSISVAVADAMISVIGVGLFAYYMVGAYLTYSVRNGYFWVTEMLAALFLLSLYYSVKTVRGLYISQKEGRGI